MPITTKPAPMKLRFRCESVTTHAGGMKVDVVLRPFNIDGNTDWIRAGGTGFPVSESGTITLTVSNHEAFGRFVAGQFTEWAAG